MSLAHRSDINPSTVTIEDLELEGGDGVAETTTPQYDIMEFYRNPGRIGSRDSVSYSQYLSIANEFTHPSKCL